MDTLLYSLLSEWDDLNQLQYDILRKLPDYRAIEQTHTALDEELRRALGEDPERLYRRYDRAMGEYLSINHRASLLTGAHATLRLLTSLL